MAKRTIPAVNSNKYRNLQLLNINTVIRHGARTPYTNYNCWAGYLESPENSRYDCTLHMLMSPKDNSDKVLFEKVYDALDPPLTNMLQGTCHVGQLLQAGYDQELLNGNHIRSAYFEVESTKNPLRLFRNSPLPVTSFDDLPPNSIRIRGDDQQRTLMSGQVLLTGVIEFNDDSETTIIYHTADYGVDPIYPNSKICPKLRYLQENAESSAEFLR